jgi:hypothetical protein
MISYYIEDRNGRRLEIEARKNARREPLEFKPDKQEYKKQGQFGVITRGTFKQASKNISLKFDIVEKSVDDYYFQLNRIAAFLYNQQNAPFYLYSIEKKQRAKVSIDSMKENYANGQETRLGLDCSLTLTMEDALWESTFDSPQTFTGFNGDSFDIILREDAVDSAGIFTITNLDAANNIEFALKLTNGSVVQNIIIAPVGFEQNKSIVLDCFNGKLKLENQFIPNAIIAGGFFPLLPGTNTILYESPSNQQARIETSYRIRRIF